MRPLAIPSVVRRSGCELFPRGTEAKMHPQGPGSRPRAAAHPHPSAASLRNPISLPRPHASPARAKTTAATTARSSGLSGGGLETPCTQQRGGGGILPRTKPMTTFVTEAQWEGKLGTRRPRWQLLPRPSPSHSHSWT